MHDWTYQIRHQRQQVSGQSIVDKRAAEAAAADQPTSGDSYTYKQSSVLDEDQNECQWQWIQQQSMSSNDRCSTEGGTQLLTSCAQWGNEKVKIFSIDTTQSQVRNTLVSIVHTNMQCEQRYLHLQQVEQCSGSQLQCSCTLMHYKFLFEAYGGLRRHEKLDEKCPMLQRCSD